MNFLIEPYLHKETEGLSFIELKKGALDIKGYDMPDEGLNVPLLTKELAENIKYRGENEVITGSAIIRGVVHLLGIDSQFKYKNEYIKFLYGVNPQIEEYIHYEAIKYADHGQLLESLLFCKTLVLLNETKVDYLFNYALTLLKYSQQCLQKKAAIKTFHDEAIKVLEQVLDIDEEFGLAYYHLGFLYRGQKQFNKAKAYWVKGLKLGIPLELQEHTEQMLKEIEEQVIYETGYEAVLGGRPREGLAHLLKLEEKYNQWWNLLFFIGLAYRQLGEFERAIEYFQQVLEYKEDQLDTMVELGLSYGSLGDLQEAIEYFQQALRLGGENSEILCNLAVIYMEAGDLKNASDCLERSLALNPEDEIARACEINLNKLKNNC